MVKRLVVALASLALLAGCAKQDLAVDTPETGRGRVTAIEALPGANAAIYVQGDRYETLQFGKLDVDFIAIDQLTFVADWDDRAVYRSLKVGDHLGFAPTGRLIRVEGSGGKDGNYRQVRLRLVD